MYYVRCMFTWNWWNDAAAGKMVVALMTRYNENACLSMRRRNTDSDKEKAECSLNRCYMHNSFSWRPYQWSAGTVAVYGQLRPHNAGIYDWSKGLKRVVDCLRVIAPELPFEIIYIELTEHEHEIEICGYTIKAFYVRHNIPCYGYSILIKRGEFS